MVKITSFSRIRSEINIPADKSISHRAIFISSVAKGKTIIRNFLKSNDTYASLECMKNLGVNIKKTSANEFIVVSKGKYFPRKNKVLLNAGQSGTTLRVISGLLVGQNFSTKIEAEGSLRKRPMKRITEPLRLMGAKIKGLKRKDEELPPLCIEPVRELRAIDYKLPISSAQVKSAIIFASLFSKGTTKIKEYIPSRDHTERMLKYFRVSLKKEGNFIYSKEAELVTPGEIFVPGDFSSAAFFVALGALLEDSRIHIKKVNVNPTRIGFLNVLKRMGARIRITERKNYFEPYADIISYSSLLRSTIVRKKEIPLMIDELPILFVCAAFAKGATVIYGLKELKVKEADRINSMVYNLKQAGVDIKAYPYRNDWCVVIKGIGNNRKKLKRASFKSFSDHRTAMSMVIMAIASRVECTLDEVDCISKSFPGFIDTINFLHKGAISLCK